MNQDSQPESGGFYRVEGLSNLVLKGLTESGFDRDRGFDRFEVFDIVGGFNGFGEIGCSTDLAGP